MDAKNSFIEFYLFIYLFLLCKQSQIHLQCVTIFGSNKCDLRGCVTSGRLHLSASQVAGFGGGFRDVTSAYPKKGRFWAFFFFLNPSWGAFSKKCGLAPGASSVNMRRNCINPVVWFQWIPLAAPNGCRCKQRCGDSFPGLDPSDPSAHLQLRVHQRRRRFNSEFCGRGRQHWYRALCADAAPLTSSPRGLPCGSVAEWQTSAAGE